MCSRPRKPQRKPKPRALLVSGWKTSESENAGYVKTMGDHGIKIMKPTAKLSSEFEALGRKSRRRQRVGDDVYELAGPELEGRQIDGELEALWPQAGIRARLPGDPFAQRVDHAGFLSQRNEPVR